MNRNYIGEFEELVLLVVGILGDVAYGVALKSEIEQQTGRKVNISAVHAATMRLEKKGLLDSTMGGAEAKRGGRRKRYYTLTMHGKTVLTEVRNTRENLWDQIPDISIS